MTATPATRVLDRAGVAYTVHTYVHDPRHDAYGAEAAEALGVDPERVLKTLVVGVEGLRAPAAVGIVPVLRRLDLKAVALAVGAKRAALAERSTAERLTGYVVGGISPLGQKRALPTVIEARAASWPTVFCSAGRRGVEVELAPGDLVALTHAGLAAIAAA